MPANPPIDPMEFADRVGNELARHLGSRARAELLELPQDAQFAAALGASLLCVADVLRDPVVRGASPARLAALCARRLEELLGQVPPRGTGPPTQTG